MDQDQDPPAPALVRPPNKIKHKVTLGGLIEGDGFDPELLKDAEARVAALRDDLIVAVDADMEKFQTACRLAATDIAGRADHLRAVSRIAHDIKGYGGNIGYDLLTTMGNSLTTFLREASASDDVRLEVAMVHMQAMRLVFYQQLTGDGGKVGRELLDALDRAVAKFL